MFVALTSIAKKIKFARHIPRKPRAINKKSDDEAAQRRDAYIQRNQSWAAYLIADIYAWHRDVDAAFTWLERAYQQHDAGMSELVADPLLVGLHDDPR